MMIAGQARACPDPRAAGLAALGHRMIEDSVALRFGAARMLVPSFGGWAYDWAQSYLISYHMMGRALARFGDSATTGVALPNAEALAHDLAEPVRGALRLRVTLPALGDGGFGRDMAHVTQTLAETWPELAPRLAPLGALDPAAHLADAVGAETVFLRSMRPMAARLGAVTLRVSEVGSVVAALGYLGWSMAGASGGVIGAVGGVGLAWGVDWVINRVDAGLNRANFESQALVMIAAAEAATMAETRGILDAALADEARARCP